MTNRNTQPEVANFQIADDPRTTACERPAIRLELRGYLQQCERVSRRAAAEESKDAV